MLTAGMELRRLFLTAVVVPICKFGWRNDPPKADSPCEFQSLLAASRLRSSTTLATTRCENHCAGEVLLDNAFVLIEGHYQVETELDEGPSAWYYILQNVMEAEWNPQSP